MMELTNKKKYIWKKSASRFAKCFALKPKGFPKIQQAKPKYFGTSHKINQIKVIHLEGAIFLFFVFLLQLHGA